MKVLVAVASRHGATAEIAAEISKDLRRPGLGAPIHADLRSADEIETLEGYGAVILGSAVYHGHWLAAAVEFAARHEAALRRLPVWLFSSGPLDAPVNRDLSGGVDGEVIAGNTNAIEHRMFAGKVDRHDLGVRERVEVRVMRMPEGDFRDWGAVRAWVAEVVERLAPPLVDAETW